METGRGRRRFAGVAGVAVLVAAAVLVSCVRVPPPSGPAAETAGGPLAIRPIDPDRDAADVQRIEELRARLPEKYRRRGNFAWASARIEGLDKAEYFAHSGIQRIGKVSAKAAGDLSGISLRPKTGRFEVLCVNHNDEVNGTNCFFRNADTERKIIEDIAKRLREPAAAGDIRLYTDLYPCASCRHVMRQFLAAYTNVQIQVLFRER
jgi:hypothetical protein